MKTKYIVVFLLFLVVVQGFIIASVKSRTIDEVTFHLNSGYNYLTTGRYDFNVENPPLSPILVSMPLLFIKNKSLFNEFEKLKQIDYIYGNGKSFDRKVLLIARIVPITLMVILGYLVFLWASQLYGAKAGVISLFLYSFSPNILAFGALVSADIAGTLFIFLSLYTFWKYMNSPTKKNLIITGLCFGLAQISKMLAVFLIPTFILYSITVYFLKEINTPFIPDLKRKNLKKAIGIFLSLLIIFIIGLFIVNLTYMFHGTFKPLKYYKEEDFMSSTFKSLHKNSILNWIPLPLPKEYLMGHDHNQWAAKDEPRSFFFWGTIGEKFKSYYLLHILIKTPIPIFILMALGFLCFRKIRLSEIYIILYIIMILLPLTFLSKLAIGYRHILSIYPIFFLLSGRLLKDGVPKNNIIKTVIGISLVWYLLGSLLVFPHHLAYFNEFIGGAKNGYKYTIDSNLDWEQDLDLVKRYISNSNEKIIVDPGCQPVTGKIIVPANSLQFQKRICYLWLQQNFKPVDYIGYSWLVYDVKGTWENTDKGYAFIKQ